MQAVDQAVNGNGGILFGGFGQACIQGSGGGVGMPEQALDMAQA